MAVWRSGGSPFEAHELAFLDGLSQQAVIALNNARLFDETQAALQAPDRQRRHPARHQPIADRRECRWPMSSSPRRGGCLAADRTAFLRREGDVLIALRHATAEGVLPGFFGRIPLDPAHNFPSRALCVEVAPAPARLVQAGAERTRARGPTQLGLPLLADAAAAARRGSGAVGRARLSTRHARGLQRARHRAGAVLRRPGRDRDRERAAVQRDEGGARAADGHRRGAAGDQRLDGRSEAGVRAASWTAASACSARRRSAVCLRATAIGFARRYRGKFAQAGRGSSTPAARPAS